MADDAIQAARQELHVLEEEGIEAKVHGSKELDGLRIVVMRASFSSMMHHYTARKTHSRDTHRYDRICEIMQNMNDTESFGVALEIYFLNRKKSTQKVADMLWGLLLFVHQAVQAVASRDSGDVATAAITPVSQDALQRFPAFVLHTALHVGVCIARTLGKWEEITSSAGLPVHRTDVETHGHRASVDAVILQYIAKIHESRAAWVSGTDVWRVFATYVEHHPVTTAVSGLPRMPSDGLRVHGAG